MKVGIAEPEETFIARQRLGKHVPRGNEYASNNRGIVRKRFMLGPPRGYIMRTPGQLMITGRASGDGS
jgi:hypothetical protein